MYTPPQALSMLDANMPDQRVNIPDSSITIASYGSSFNLAIATARTVL